jgi:O-antigen/teichoic acid export membrane protein
MNLFSVRTRFLVSIGSNGLRAALGFATGLLLARALQPAGYGDFGFLLGSFVSLRTLLDMGSSNAFYTFIARQRCSRKQYLYFCSWIAVQFVIVTAAILLLPSGLISGIWLRHSRSIILLSFFAAFCQQQIWLTVSQIGEASRQTVKVQAMNIAIAAVHLVLVICASLFHRLSVPLVFVLIIAEYISAVAWAAWLLRSNGSVEENAGPVRDLTLPDAIREYASYCRPLIVLAVLSFMSDMGDKWLLQRFGGSIQQGLFQISSQFASVSLIATTSILNVFWKEVAEASASENRERVARLYRGVIRSLVVVGAAVSAFLIPWSKEIVTVLLGSSYALAAPIFAIMLLYPVHQSMGQIVGTTFLATGRTRTYLKMGILTAVVSVPATYFMLAPRSGLLPGLGLGAVGLAIKLVIINVLLVNLQSWLLAHQGGWRYDWLFQFTGFAAFVLLSFGAKLVVSSIWNIDLSKKLALVFPFVTSGVLYIVACALVLWCYPAIIGAERGRNALSRLRTGW